MSLRIACDVCGQALGLDARNESSIRSMARESGWVLLKDHGGRFNSQTAWWILDICKECNKELANEPHQKAVSNNH